jgi:transposase InsO family protein
MGWRESNAIDARIEFVAAVLQGEETMTALCADHGISRKTGYKWCDRYRLEGCAGLVERSHAPHRHGRTTAPALVEAIEALRRQRPSWGARKIVAWLSGREPEIVWPSASTADAILRRAGLVTRRRRHPRAPPRQGGLTEPCHANHVWAADHKGWVRLGDGSRAEPLTVTDGFSRYLIALSATGSTALGEARPLFERAFAEHGLPEVIRSDNGTPFAAAGPTGLTQLSAWWIKLGIRHERIDPGVPQQNGRHERFHLTLLEAMRPPAADRAEQQQRFDAFQADYNSERPHQALGQKPPASLYRASLRPLPDRLPEPIYGAEVAARQVRSNGEIRWRGDLVHVSSALAGETVGVEETEAGEWQVRFFDVPLGIIDQTHRKLRRPRQPKLPTDADRDPSKAEEV